MLNSAPRTILVSACLLGIRTRYDGETRNNAAVINFLKTGNWLPIPVCPEQLGGLPTPRPMAEFKTGDGNALLAGTGLLLNSLGIDVSAAFLHGAEQTLEIAKYCNCSNALFKEKSPSCGVNNVYCNGKLITGLGVTTARLRKNSVNLYSEVDLVDGRIPGSKD